MLSVREVRSAGFSELGERGMQHQAIVDVGDLIDALCEDERVTTIGLFLEGIGDVPRFSRAAAKAAERNLPIVALKVGATTSPCRRLHRLLQGHCAGKSPTSPRSPTRSTTTRPMRSPRG